MLTITNLAPLLSAITSEAADWQSHGAGADRSEILQFVTKDYV